MGASSAFSYGGFMLIIGIDYSISGPAISILGDDFMSSQHYFATTKKKHVVQYPNIKPFLIDKNYHHNIDRYEKLADWAIKCIDEHFEVGNTTFVMEGYAFASQSGLICNIAENGGLLKYKIFKRYGLSPEIVAPTALKKLWTGKGNAKKEVMIQSLLDQEGVDILKMMCMDKPESPAADVVDAYALAKTYA